ncbi:MAG: NAD(P)H-hydrate epimerase [Gammaproteobacteria bacterium]|jgi:NAD(P)H-hydrate epimerase|nr:NAD(P)H-hydrate epimerase [Gammaproteobacteria bacterium]MBT6042996.1 NAD(P)H-hydrate epimerase [Gammaproteobacteria bacterium]
MNDKKYYLASAVRELDRLAIEEHQIPGFTLMQRAGQAALTALLNRWPGTRQLLCFCGSGNNGGDGYVMAALARAKGITATVIAVGNIHKLKGDARLAYEMATKQGVEVIAFPIFDIEKFLKYQGECVVVDAMLGTGLSGKVTGDTLKAIELINATTFPVLAVDIPSGLSSDTGEIPGDAVKAEMTVTFIGRKLGQIIKEGPQTCGEIVFDDLEVPGEIFKLVTPVTRR